jgi:hypothetical protein
MRDDRILELERVRLMVEAGRNMTGMLYDYLDRGLPTEEQQSLTWKALKSLEERDRRLSGEFGNLFRDTKESDPGAIGEWAGRHLRICSGVIMRGESRSSGYPDPGLEVLFARKHRDEWGLVEAGETLCVVQHSLMMEYHRDLQEREFGRIEGVRDGLPGYPWKTGE